MAESKLAHGTGGDPRGNKDLRRLVITGKAGVGKSSVGNLLLGKNAFVTSGASQTNITQECQSSSVVRGRYDIHVMDLPDLLGGSLSAEDEEKQILEMKRFTSKGIDAVLLVLRVGRIAETGGTIISRLKYLFGKDVFKYIIVTFCGKDDMEYDRISCKQFISKTETWVQELLDSCAGRVVFVDSGTSKDLQSGDPSHDDLMNYIADLYNRNKGKHFYPEVGFSPDHKQGISTTTFVTTGVLYTLFLLLNKGIVETEWWYRLPLNWGFWIAIVLLNKRMFWQYANKKDMLVYWLIAGTVWFNITNYGLNIHQKIGSNAILFVSAAVLGNPCKCQINHPTRSYVILLSSIVAIGLIGIMNTLSDPGVGVKVTFVVAGWMAWINRKCIMDAITSVF